MALFRPGTATGTSSFAETASYALTASFVTASSVWGPFGSSSVDSASYSLTASYALNAGTPGGSNTHIQFNSASAFSGSTNFTFDYTSNVVYLTGSSLTSGSIILTGSMGVSGAISSSNGPETVGFYGTASWAVSASRAISASRADSAAVANALSPGASVPAAPPEYAIQFNNTNLLDGDAAFLFKYPSQSMEHGFSVTASGVGSYAQGSGSFARGFVDHAEGLGAVTGLRALSSPNITFGTYLGFYNTIEISDGIDYTEAFPYSSTTFGAFAANANILLYRASYGLVSVIQYSASYAAPVFTLVTNTSLFNPIVEVTAIADMLMPMPAKFANTTIDIPYTVLGAVQRVQGYGAHAEGQETQALSTGSHTEGFRTIVNSNYGHAEGWETRVWAQATGSHAEGYSTNVYGEFAHAEGEFARALNRASHAEGYNTTTQGDATASHAEGAYTIANASFVHVEGYNTEGYGWASHAEGRQTQTHQTASHAEGYLTWTGQEYYTGTNDVVAYPSKVYLKIFGTPQIYAGDLIVYNSSATGRIALIVLTASFGGVNTELTVVDAATGIVPNIVDKATFTVGVFNRPNLNRKGLVWQQSVPYSHAEGEGSSTVGWASHAEGYYPTTYGSHSHAEGYETSTVGRASHAEGYRTIAAGLYSHAEGSWYYKNSSTFQHLIASGSASHAEGQGTQANGSYSHTEGFLTKTIGEASHAEGNQTTARADYSHAEGSGTLARGTSAHAEGESTTAEGQGSHAEGDSAYAAGDYSHAEGAATYANADWSHAEGTDTYTENDYSHAEGESTTAYGFASHAEGYLTQTGDASLTTGDYSHAEGDSTKARGYGSHAEGYLSETFGANSHAGGWHTVASASYVTTIGQFNLHNNLADLFTIGDGANNGSRHDLLNAGIGFINISGSATISSSLNVIGISNVTGSNNITGSWDLKGDGHVTGSLDLTGSYSLQGIGVVSGSFLITGSLVANYANLTGSLTGSFFGTGSGDFDGQFIGRVTGSMTGSFIGTGSGNFDGRFVGQLTGSATGSFTGTGSGNFDGRFIGSVTGSTTGSFIGTGSGYFDGLFTGSNANGVSFYGTSSWAVTASYVTGSIFNNTNPVLSASYAESSSYALSASYSVTSSYAESASYALSASYSVTSSYAESASYALSASYSVTSSYAESSSYALSASYSVTASHAINALVTASVSLNDITFYKGDGTQFVITVDTGSGGSGPGGGDITDVNEGLGITVTNPSGPAPSVALNTGSAHFTSGVSNLTGSLLTTISFNSWTGSATSYFAGTASYATQSLSSSFAETASAVNVTLSSNVDERLPIILAYTSSNTGAKLAYIDAGFDYNTSTNALYLPSAGAIIVGNTTIQSSAATFGSATAQNHIVKITGSLNVSKSVNVEGAVTAGFGANTVGFVGTASWAVSASHVSGAFMQNGNSFGTAALLGTNDTQDLTLETNGVQRIFISSSGQTWLGSAPSQQFSGTNAPIQMYAGTGTGNGVGIRGQVIYFYPAGAQTTASLQYGSAGLAAWQLRNLGTQAFQIRSTPGGSSSTTLMHFASGSSGQERVGIMTETPQHTLDVSGSARITGSFYLPGVTSSPYNNVLIIDTGSGQVYVTASSAIGGGGVPGGALRSIQFNSESVFSGSNNFTFNENTNQLDLTGSMVISGGLRTVSTNPSYCYLDTNNGSLHAPNGNVILDWYNTLLNDYQQNTVLNIGARTLVWDNGSTAINFGTDNEVVVNGDVYLDDLTAATPAADADDVVLINSVTGQLYYTASTAFGGGSGTPGGSLRSIQFNSASVFSGSNNFTFDETTNSVYITGSLTVSGSNTFRNIGPAEFTGSIAVTENVIATSFTGSLLGTASYVTGSIFTSTNQALSASYALTASYAANVVTYSSNEGITQSGTTFKLGDNSSIGAYNLIPFTEDRYIDFGNDNNSLFFTKQSSLLFKLSGSGQLKLDNYSTSTAFQGSSGTSIGVLHTDNTGRIFVSSSGTSFTYNSTSSVIGDGAATSFNINHGFNTRNLHITVYESGSNGETVYPDIRRINENTVSILFANPPASLEYIVYVSQ